MTTTNPDAMLKMTFYSHYSEYIAISFLSIRMHWFTVGDGSESSEELKKDLHMAKAHSLYIY